MPHFTPTQLHSKKLWKQGKHLGFTKCPHCEMRGGLWKAHDEGETGWIRYCYYCSYREVVERRIEREIRLRSIDKRIAANELRIQELLRRKEKTT